jgi:hypothetical protein
VVVYSRSTAKVTLDHREGKMENSSKIADTTWIGTAVPKELVLSYVLD